MSRKNQRTYSPSLKIELLKKHLVDHVAISTLCEEHRIKPSLFYRWQQELFLRGAALFELNKSSDLTKNYESQIKKLHDQLTHKNTIIVELMDEHMKLKKQYGER